MGLFWLFGCLTSSIFGLVNLVENTCFVCPLSSYSFESLLCCGMNITWREKSIKFSNPKPSGSICFLGFGNGRLCCNWY